MRIDKYLKISRIIKRRTVANDACDAARVSVNGRPVKSRLLISALDKTEELITYVQDRPGHDRRYAIDNTKITTQLGWSPAYTFEVGIQKTIQWYLDNAEWMEQVTSGNYQSYYEKMYQKN